MGGGGGVRFSIPRSMMMMMMNDDVVIIIWWRIRSDHLNLLGPFSTLCVLCLFPFLFFTNTSCTSVGSWDHCFFPLRQHWTFWIWLSETHCEQCLRRRFPVTPRPNVEPPPVKGIFGICTSCVHHQMYCPSIVLGLSFHCPNPLYLLRGTFHHKLSPTKSPGIIVHTGGRFCKQSSCGGASQLTRSN